MAPQQRDKSGLKGLHAKERGSGACTSTRAVGCGLQGSARELKLRMLRVYRCSTEDGSGLWSLHDGLHGEARCTGW